MKKLFLFSLAALLLGAASYGQTCMLQTNCNGGAGCGGSYTGGLGASYNLETPTRTGYTFAGWNTAADGTGTSYAVGALVPCDILFQGSPKVVYAQWTPNTFYIAYNAHGGSGYMGNTTCTYDASCTLRTNTFTRTDYTFAGWTAYSTGTLSYQTPTHAEGASVKNLLSTNGDTHTFYAQWLANHTVTFKMNDSTSSNYATQTVVHSRKATQPSPEPVRTGYTFKGWYKEAACISLWNFNADVVTGDITLYARWAQNLSAGSCPEGVDFTIKIPFRRLPQCGAAQYRWYRDGQLIEGSDGMATSEDSFITCTIPASEAYGVNVVFYFEYWLYDGLSHEWTRSPRYIISFVPVP